MASFSGSSVWDVEDEDGWASLLGFVPATGLRLGMTLVDGCIVVLFISLGGDISAGLLIVEQKRRSD